uniref:NADH-ubiquinone oxidoreductase chain 5 n=1 Tax=Acerella muscorum TaxID=187596 RepID=A0A0C4K2E3_9HEXA|nr:NADH dehydrogenase subunit 5 [Acerella muscorum]AHL42965.1 NADH dehydrogenase subunit 5 [Acerella muscorum]
MNWFILMMFQSFFFVFFSMNFINYSTFFEFNIKLVNSYIFSFIIYLDWISLMFIGVVLFISSNVILYSNYYMKGNKTNMKFIMLIIMFILSMFLVIMSPNLLSIMLGWDGLGLISYFLVIYYNNQKSNISGMLTILTNRLGDVTMIMSLIYMFNLGMWNIMYYDLMYLNYKIIYLMIFIGGITKSAQIPFSSWLPAAMAAPTPISALVHSSTLVTAGVYLFIRFSPYISIDLFYIILTISLMTSFMAGASSIYENDYKKIVALSTLSQLGIMIMVLSLGNFMFSFFHLIMHALFKSLIFLCSGIIIHGCLGNQDIRYMGYFFYSNPLLCLILNISNLSLMGFPFLCGFYSKDLIIEYFILNKMNMFMLILMYLSLMFTSIYSLRMIYYSFLINQNMMIYTKEENLSLIPLINLFLMTLSGGSLFSWLFFFNNNMIYINMLEKIFSLNLMIVGMLLVLLNNKMKYYLSLSKNLMLTFISSMWAMNYKSSFYYSYITMYTSNKIFSIMDNMWNENLGPQGIFNYIKNFNNSFIWWNKLELKLYLLMFIFMYWMIF